jgi:hypothetical protein
MAVVTSRKTQMVDQRFCSIAVYFPEPIGENKTMDASGILLFRFFPRDEPGCWSCQRPVVNDAGNHSTSSSSGMSLTAQHAATAAAGGGLLSRVRSKHHGPLEFQATSKNLWLGAITTSRFVRDTGELYEAPDVVVAATPAASNKAMTGDGAAATGAAAGTQQPSSDEPITPPLPDGVIERLVGPSLFLGEDLLTAHTGYSVTYRNDPLCVDGETCRENGSMRFNHFYFDIVELELYSFPRV